MEDLNSCQFIGRLTRDAELRYTNSGTAVASFSIAVSKRINGEDRVSFFDMVLWGKLAESISKYLDKGKQVAVTAEATQERWQTREGDNRYAVKFNVRTLQLLSSPNSNNQWGGNYSNQRPVNNRQETSSRSSAYSGPEDFDDDIPF